MKDFRDYLIEADEAKKKIGSDDGVDKREILTSGARWKAVKEGSLYRLVALKDFTLPMANGRYAVKKGDEGGLIEKESNLSQEGSCWIHEDARVTGNARVYGDAQILDRAHVYGKAKVYGSVHLRDKAQVYEEAQVYGNASVYQNAKVYGKAHVYGYAWLSTNAKVYGNIRVSGNEDSFIG